MNTQTEERRSDNLAFRRMFEPKLIDPKLSGAGVLTFSTSVVMKAYQVMVSSTEHNEVKFVDFEVSSTDVIYDRLLETAFPGKLVRDPVVMVRIWELGDTEWSLWKDVDVSEYVSAHQEIRKTTDLPEETQLAFLPEVIPPTNGDHGVNGSGRLPWWQFGRQSIRALVERIKLWSKNGNNGHNGNHKTTTPENERTENMKTKTKPTKTTGMPEVAFPSTSISIQPMSGVDAYKIEFLENAQVVGSLTIPAMGDTAATVKTDFLLDVKFAPDHPKDDTTSYAFNASAIKGGKEFGVPAVFGFTGAQLVAGLTKARANVATTPAAPTPTPAPAKPAAAPNTAPAAEKPLDQDDLREIARITGWISMLAKDVQRAKTAENIKRGMLNSTVAALDKMDGDIAQLEKSCGQSQQFTELKTRQAELEVALEEIGQTFKQQEQLRNAQAASAGAPVTQTQAKAPVAQVTQTGPTATPPPTGTNQVPPQPPTPPVVPSTPLVPAPQSGGGLKWVAMGCGLMALLAMALFVVVVGIIAYYKLASHSKTDNGITRRPLVTQPAAPRPLPVPTVIPPPVAAATPATNTPQGGVTTVVETRDGNKVSTTVTNSNGFIAIAPAIGENSQVKIIQVGGNYSDPSGSQVNGMGEWPNDSAPTVTTNICLSKPLASGEEELFILAINPADDIAITLQTGNCTVLHYVTSPDGKGDVVPTPVKLYDIAFNGRRIDSTGGSEGSNGSILRLRNRTGARIILGLRCVKN